MGNSDGDCWTEAGGDGGGDGRADGCCPLLL